MPAIWLTSRGYNVTCIAPGSGAGHVVSTPLGDLQVDFLGQALNLAGHFRLLARLLGYRWRSDRRTAFYIHGSVVCPAAWLALAGSRRRQVIYHTQDFLEPGRHPHWEFFEKRVARRAGRVICNEPSRARFMASHYKLRAVPDVVRTALPARWPVPGRDPAVRRRLVEALGLGGHANPLVLLHAGPFSDVRCSRAVIEALSGLPARYGLVFTGTRPDTREAAEGLAAAHAAGVAQRVLFLPPLQFQDLLAHMAASDVGLLLYPNDGVGNFFQAPGRLSEYLRAGLPIVTSAFPGLENLVLRYRLGASCNPTSVKSIAEAIVRASQCPTCSATERERLKALAEGELCFDAGAAPLEDAVHRAARGQLSA